MTLTAPYSTHISRQHAYRRLSHAISVIMHLEHSPDESLLVLEGDWRQWRSIWSYGCHAHTHGTVLYSYLPTTCISTALSCHIHHYALRTYAGRKLVDLEGILTSWRSIWSHGNCNDTHSTILYTYLPTTCISTALSCHIRHYTLRACAGWKLVDLGGILVSFVPDMVAPHLYSGTNSLLRFAHIFC